MLPLYAVDLDVARGAGDEEAGDAAELVTAHLAEWVTHLGASTGADDFHGSGERDLDPGSVSWSVHQARGARVLHLRTRRPLGDEDAWIVCRVTVGVVDDTTTLRVALGREIAGGIVSAHTLEVLRRPAVLGLIAADPRLTLSVHGDRASTRYDVVPTASVADLVERLRRSDRLPVLVVDAVRREAADFGKAAARELVGLADVACLRDPRALEELRNEVPDLAPPWGGARLVWPNSSARHPAVRREQLSDARTAEGVERLFRLIGTFSAAARGRDHALEEVRRRQRAAELQEVEDRAAAAAARGDLNATVEELRTALAAKSRELDEYIEMIGAEAHEAQADVEVVREQLVNAQQEATYWRELYQDSQHSGHETAQSVDDAPDDVGAELFNFLNETTTGAIVFTPAAEKSWKKSRYPYPEKMRAALIDLARAAVEWREKSGDVGAIGDDWLKQTYGLNSAFTDQGLGKSRGNTFTFEGRTFDRTPHLKLDDHTSPDRVGRVYFAMDTDAWRLIVDHVGLKLYGRK